MHRGYTKRWRKRWDKGYHTDVYLWLLMDYFIDFANYKDTDIYFPGCGMISLKRGQHIFGYRKASEFLNIGMSMTRRKIKLLEDIGFLTLKATHQYSIATVMKYDTYQPKDNGFETQTDTPSESGRKAVGKRSELPNKDKKGNKVKNTNGAHGWPEGFSLDDKKIEYAIKNGINKDKVKSFFDDFHDWALSKGATYKDWDAAFRTRVGKAKEYGRQFLKDPTKYEKGSYTSEDAHKRYKNFMDMVNK